MSKDFRGCCGNRLISKCPDWVAEMNKLGEKLFFLSLLGLKRR